MISNVVSLRSRVGSALSLALAISISVPALADPPSQSPPSGTLPAGPPLSIAPPSGILPLGPASTVSPPADAPPAYAPPPTYAPPKVPVAQPTAPTAPRVESPPPRADEPSEVVAPDGPSKRRNLAAMVSGIAIGSLGGLGIVSGTTLYIAAGRQGASGGLALLITGFIGLGIGLPLGLYGGKRIPVQSAWVGAPGGAGWTWRF